MCDEVTEIQCEIVPYTECQMTMDPTPYKSFDMVTKTFNKRVCKEGMDVVQHTKMMPECRNVTKQNCITKWETDEDGNQASNFLYLLFSGIFSLTIQIVDYLFPMKRCIVIISLWTLKTIFIILPSSTFENFTKKKSDFDTHEFICFIKTAKI